MLAVTVLMTKEEFKTLWAGRYPSSVPIASSLRHDYPERWFRIHSLADSKRYPDNEDEWTSLLNRQKTIITDVLGDGAKILFITGDYYFERYPENQPIDDVYSIKGFSFNKLETIDLHALWPDEYDNGQIFGPIFCELTWSQHKFDHILREIAHELVRVIFMSVEYDSLIIPYDGGIDLILKDHETRDQYKSKYSEWLSRRSDGL